MNQFKPGALAAAFSVLLCANTAAAEEKSFVASIKDGKASLGFRLRTEDVSQDTATGSIDATAITLRTRLNFTSGAYKGFSGFVEMDHVNELDDVDYNTGPGGQAFPGSATIADPEGTDLNQAYVQYKSGGATIKWGRQRILLDNQRFVGGVGWRQNEQTYDAFSYTNTSFSKLKVFAAYISNVNRIFGDDRAPAGDNANSTVLLNAKYTIGDIGSLTGFGYLIDNEDLTQLSSDTFGLRFAGAKSNWGYSVDIATQTDAGDNVKDYSATFFAGEVSYNFNPVKVKLGHQVLGADGSDGQFITPFATLHAFQGWADKFLGGGSGNIVGGLVDTYASVGGKFGKVTGSVVYHQFSADDASARMDGVSDYGSELGLVFKGKAGPVGLLLKASGYSADDLFTDTEKVWLMASTKF